MSTSACYLHGDDTLDFVIVDVCMMELGSTVDELVGTGVVVVVVVVVAVVVVVVVVVVDDDDDGFIAIYTHVAYMQIG